MPDCSSGKSVLIEPGRGDIFWDTGALFTVGSVNALFVCPTHLSEMSRNQWFAGAG
jgi:hypothetical protein